MNRNKIKILIVFIFIIFTSGCSAEYSLSLNEDSSVNEVVTATERTDRLESKTKLKGAQAVNYIYNMFVANDDNYTLSYSENNSNTIAKVNATYSSIDDYANIFKSDIFDNIVISRDEDYVTITTKQLQLLGGDSPITPMYDSIDIIIQIPFEVTENNADSVEGNKYIWKIRKDGELKDINITYKQDEIPNKINIKINDNKYNFEYWYIVVIIFALILVSIVAVVLIKNRKNNVV